MIIGTGIDIVEITRVESILERTPRMMERILTEQEREAIPTPPSRQLEYIAGRFAVKEAFSKALGVGISKDFSWHDISVVNDERGKPYLLYHREEYQTEEWQEIKVHLSISHERSYVVAIVILEKS